MSRPMNDMLLMRAFRGRGNAPYEDAETGGRQRPTIPASGRSPKKRGKSLDLT